MTQISPAQEADALAACVDLGLGDLPEITQWADAQLAQTAEPTDWMLSLSGKRHTDLVDVLHILQTIPGPRDHALSVRMALGRLRARRPTIGPADADLMRRLFKLTLKKIPEEIKNAIYRLDHDWDMVTAGYGKWSLAQKTYDDLLALGASEMKDAQPTTPGYSRSARNPEP